MLSALEIRIIMKIKFNTCFFSSTGSQNNRKLSIADVIAMKERLKELAKNGKTFSVRDIIAMKNEMINGKMQVSDNVAERLKRPVPMAQPPSASRSTGPSSSSSIPP